MRGRIDYLQSVRVVPVMFASLSQCVGLRSGRLQSVTTVPVMDVYDEHVSVLPLSLAHACDVDGDEEDEGGGHVPNIIR